MAPHPLFNGTRPVSENPATAGLCGPFANSIQDSLRISNIRAKRRALMAQLIACCSWSAYGHWASKKVGLPSSMRLVPWITHRSQHLVEPLKPVKRHQAPKREGQGQNRHKASNGLRKRPKFLPYGPWRRFFSVEMGLWLSCVKTSHRAIQAVFSVCNRRKSSGRKTKPRTQAGLWVMELAVRVSD